MRKRLDELQELAQEALRAVRDCEASVEDRGEALDELEYYAWNCAAELRAKADKSAGEF